MKTIDLIVDMAEGDPWDDDLLGLCTSAAVCCGAHAGSPELARETAARCRARGVRVVAHPGYPDRTHKGRENKTLDDDSAAAQLLDVLSKQVEILKDAEAVKLHGALYHQANTSLPHSGVLTALLFRTKLPLVGWKNGRQLASARAAGVSFFCEGFADRRLDSEGRMIARSQPDALLKHPDEIRESIIKLAPDCQSLCVHGDTPGCADILAEVRKILTDEGWRIAHP